MHKCDDVPSINLLRKDIFKKIQSKNHISFQIHKKMKYKISKFCLAMSYFYKNVTIDFHTFSKQFLESFCLVVLCQHLEIIEKF